MTNHPVSKETKKIKMRLFINELQVSSGMNRNQLQKMFQSKESFWRENSNIFYKYANGSTHIKKIERIDSIEKQFPGTTRILNHPLWFILENPQCNLKSIHKKMQSLEPKIRSRVCEKDKKTGAYFPKERRNDKNLYYIAMNNNLDALACLLMIIRKMEILQKPNTRSHAKWFTHWLFFRLAHYSPLKDEAKKLYELIYDLFIGKEDPPKIYKPYSYIPCFGNFTPPPFIRDIKQIDDKLTDTLSLAENHNFKVSDKQSQLKFLFWCCTFGINRVNLALGKQNPTPEDSFIIEKLRASFKSTAPKKYLPRASTLSVFGPYCMIESTESIKNHDEILKYL